MDLSADISKDILNIVGNANEMGRDASHVTPANVSTPIKVIPLDASAGNVIQVFDDASEVRLNFMTMKSEIIVKVGDKIIYNSITYKVDRIVSSDEWSQVVSGISKKRDRVHGRK
ncbi:MAG: hypothetical protein COA79_20980 [Planctomycetota bacterium]|nr:MAG: hypothetical protein COA79_20980 [Planctomycetota bacterium]